MNKVKFSVFSDLHASREWGTDGEKRLDAILERAQKENVDFVVDLGDFCHNPMYNQDEKALVEKYKKFPLPTYHVLGEEEQDTMTISEAVDMFGMPAENYFFDKNGFRFICLNSNYFRYEATDMPYSQQFNPFEFDSVLKFNNLHAYKYEFTGDYEESYQNFLKAKAAFMHYGPYYEYIPQNQVKWLEETIMDSPYPVIVLSHGSLSLESDDGALGIKNRREIKDVFCRVHEKGKRVLMCLHGHLHVDFMRIEEHVCYFSVNSASMYRLDVDNPYYPDEFRCQPYKERKRSLMYEDPVHAVITISEDGTIEIDGMKSAFWYGIDKKKVDGHSCMNRKVKVKPEVLSETIQLPVKL